MSRGDLNDPPKMVYRSTLDVSINEQAADCDGNAGITAEDALWILKKVVGLV